MESNKTSRFSIAEKQKNSYEGAVVNKYIKKPTKTWLRKYLEWANKKKKPKNIEISCPKILAKFSEIPTPTEKGRYRLRARVPGSYASVFRPLLNEQRL